MLVSSFGTQIFKNHCAAPSRQVLSFQKRNVSAVTFGIRPEQVVLPTKPNNLRTKYYGKKKLRLPLSFNFLQNQTLWAKEDIERVETRDPRAPEIPPSPEELRNLQLLRKIISFSRIYDSEDNDSKKIYFKNVPFFLNEKELKKTLAVVGIVKSIIYHRDRNGQFLGSGIAEYSLETSAQAAVKNLDGHFLIQRNIAVAPFERSPAQLNYTNLLLTTNLPDDVNSIRNTFSQYGEVKSIKRINSLGKADKNVVRHVIEFSSVDDAVEARHKVHNTKVGNSSVCVQFCASQTVKQPSKLTHIDLSVPPKTE